MNLAKLKKIKSIILLKKYGLPIPETIFISNFKKQEKEIDDFIRGRKSLTIRSDKVGKTDFCPYSIGCPQKETKKKIKELVSKGFVVILQGHVPLKDDRISGNILILKNNLLVELMGEGPLTWLNREGQVEEQIKIRKSGFKEIEHFGKRLIKRKELTPILKMVKRLPLFSLVEFTLRPEGLYFWQIKEDKTAKKMEN